MTKKTADQASSFGLCFGALGLIQTMIREARIASTTHTTPPENLSLACLAISLKV
ncbi:MAG: hypothetical protein HUU38_32445, partial [Anaerolineales bacterium]|nr:hypothetical protein [Anaerolineales bacterium]